MPDQPLTVSQEDIEAAWKSPAFHALPEDQRIWVMSQMDQRFSSLPAMQKRILAATMSKRYGVPAPPPPDPIAGPDDAALALARSGLTPSSPRDIAQQAMVARKDLGSEEVPLLFGNEKPRGNPMPPPAASRNPMRRSSDLAAVPQDPYYAEPAPPAPPTPVNIADNAIFGKAPAAEPIIPASKPTGVIRNIARPGPHVTLLPQNEELKFRQWVTTNKIPFDPGPQSDYDMRGYWKALRNRDQRVAGTDPLNPPPEFQTPYHPEFSNKSIFAGADAPKWMKDKLVDSFGRTIKDKAAEKAAEKMLAQKNVDSMKKAPKPGLAEVTPGMERLGGTPPGIPAPPQPGMMPSWEEGRQMPVAQPGAWPMVGETPPAEMQQYPGWEKDPSIALGTSIANSAVQMGTSAPGGVLTMAGNAMGSDVLRNTGANMTAAGDVFSEANSTPPVPGYDQVGSEAFKDPRWWANTIGNGIGSMAPLMLAGMGTGAILERAVGSGLIRGALAENVIKYGPAATSGLSEGILAGGSAYNEAKAAGKSEAEAQEVFAIVAATTAATAVPAFKVGAFNDALPMAGKIPASMAAEGAQEVAQGVGENYAAGRPLMADSMENFVGGAFGGAGGAAMEGGHSRPARVSPSMQQEFEGLDREMRGPAPNPPPPGAPPATPPASNQQAPQAAPPAAPTPNPASAPPQQAEAAPQAPPPPPKKKNPMAKAPAAPAAPTIEEIPADIEEMLAKEEETNAAPEVQDEKQPVTTVGSKPDSVPVVPEVDGVRVPVDDKGPALPGVQPVDAGAAGPAPSQDSQVDAKPPREFSSTQVNLPPAVAKSVMDAGSRIADEDLTEDGRETEPHATVKFGLHTNDAEEVRAILADEPPVRVKLGKVSLFENKDADVVKIDLDSADLHRLNKKIADALPHTDSHPTYQPHVTLGYVKPGQGKKYLGLNALEGQEFTVDAITFSGKDRQKVSIPLGGKSIPSSETSETPAPVKQPAADEKGSFKASDNRDRDFGVRGETQPNRAIAKVTIHPNKKGMSESVDTGDKTPLVRGTAVTMALSKEEWDKASKASANALYGRRRIVKQLMEKWGDVDFSGPNGAHFERIADKAVDVFTKLFDGQPATVAPTKNPMRKPEPAPTQTGPSTAPAPEKPGGFDIAGAAGMTDEELIRQVMQNLEGMGIKPPAQTQTAANPPAAAKPPKPKNPMRKPSTQAAPPATPASPKAPAPSKNPLDAAAEKARQALDQMLKDAMRGQSNAGIDPTALVHLATIGAKHIIDGAIAFKEWSARFTADAGAFVAHFAKVSSQTTKTILNAIHQKARAIAKAYGIEAEEAPNEQAGDDQPDAANNRPLGETLSGPDRGAKGDGDAGEGSAPRGGADDIGPGSRGEVGNEPDGSDGTGGRGVGSSTEPVRSSNPGSARFERDYRIPDGRKITGTPEKRYEMNVAAIRRMLELEESGNIPTPEDHEILSQYVGWGAVPQVFAANKPEWVERQKELRGLISPEEYSAAAHSTLNAHYTGDEHVDAIWQALIHLGARPGMSWLEPAVGNGTFFGRQPAELLFGARRVGIEKETVTGRITRLLYPDSGIEVSGYEEADLPKNYFDGIVSNVPFGKYGVFDPEFKSKGYLTRSIHNYFFAKALDHVKPGGVVAFITSAFTMDAYSEEAVRVRKYLASKADLLGAVRLPSDAFKATAGTHVVTDVIFLRRRAEGEAENHSAPWMESKYKELPHEDGGTTKSAVNEYYHQHPEYVLGEEKVGGGARSRDDYKVIGKATGEEIQAAMKKALPAGVLQTKAEINAPTAVRVASVKDADVAKVGGFVLGEKGELYVKASKGALEPITVSKGVKDRIIGQMKIRDARAELLDAERGGASDEVLSKLRKTLNDVYDKFVKINGILNSRSNIAAFSGDPDAPLLRTLETRIQDTTAKKATLFTKRIFQPQADVDKAGTAKDALSVSLNETAGIDWPRMEKLTGKTAEELQEELQGLVYQDPITEQWQTAEEYLSGSVRSKLKDAKRVAKLDKKFQANVEALQSVLPEDLTPGQISVRTGATWVPAETYEQFLREALGLHGNVTADVKYSESAGWDLKNVSFRAATKNKYESPGRTQEKNIRSAFEAKRVKVFDKMSDDSRVFNPDKTAAAQAIVDQFHTDFETWLFGGDTARGEAMVELYNDKMNDIRLRQFDGSHLTLPGIAAGVELFPHQKNAIWRIISSRNTLLAHSVGAGKTFEMIAGAMELKRMGLVQRPMFVVPNQTLGGFAEQFAFLYPDKKVIVFSENDLKKDKRRATIARIASEEWDAVVIPHSSFQFIRVSDEMFEESLAERIKELAQRVEDAKDGGVPTQQIKRMEKQNEEEIVALKKRRNDGKQDRAVNWEELGIDMLTVDEAHEYKKLGFSTKMGNVMGIDTNGNQKTFDLHMKMRQVQKRGRGVVFATGTPVTNTMGELFTLMRYLIPDEMKSRQLGQFDEWAASFGRTVSSFEPKPEGGGYHIKERFARFVNIADLSLLFRTFADVVTSEMLNIPRPEVVRETIVTEMSPEQKRQMDDMQERAKAIRDDPKEALPDNMLAIYTDATKLALDERFLNPLAGENPDGRVAKAADKISEIWRETKANKSTQLVFADMGTPAEKSKKKKAADDYQFPLYDAIAEALEQRGIPRKEIAFIHDAKTNKQRIALADKVRDGEIRVLLGSSQKLGVGVNVQKLLYAIHHLDMPHLPAYMEQRDGRGHRQGNENEKVHIYHYLTKGTLDELKSSNLARKTKFIEAFLRGDASIREMEDVADASLTYEQFQAQASNDPRVPRMMDLTNELARLGVVRSAWTDKRLADARKARLMPAEIRGFEQRVEGYANLVKVLQENSGKFTVGKEEFKVGGSAEGWEKLAQAIGDEALAKGAELMQAKDSMKVQIGTGFGMPLSFGVTVTKSGKKDEVQRHYQLDLLYKPLNIYAFQTATYVDDDGKVRVSPNGLNKTLQMLDRNEHYLETAKEDLSRAEDTYKELTGSTEATWPLAKKYEEMAAELKKIQTELGMNKDDKSAGATGGDEIVDPNVQGAEKPVGEDEESDEDIEDEPTIRRPVTRGGDQAGFMAPDFLATIFGGLAGRIRGNPTQKQTKDYHQFPEEVEKAFQAAGRAQEEPKGIMDTLKEAYTDFKALGRVYRHLSRADFGPVVNKMVRLQKAQGIASSRAMISMSKLVHQTGKMSRPDYELLRKAVIVDDLVETVELFAEKGEPLADDHKLAFNFTPATLRTEQARLKAAIADNEAVTAALEYRRRVWDQIKTEYMDAMKDAGEDVTGKLQRKNYYRHQVLLQKRLEALAAAGKMAVPNQRSFLKARDVENVGMDYATNFVETELKVMTQLMIDTQTAQFVAWLDGKHNIIRDLKEKAKWKNVATVMPYFERMAADANANRGPQDDSEPLTGDDMFRRTLNRQQAIAMDELGKLAAADLLPDTADGKWAETIAALADRHLAKKAAEDEESFHGDSESGNVIGYAAWILRQPEASAASRAAGSLFKGIRNKQATIKKIAGDKFVTWEDMVPDTHRAYQMDPTKAYYSVFTIPEHLALKAMEDEAETIGIKKEDIRKVFARGADKDPMILPEQIVKQFEEMQATMAARKVQENILGKGSRAIIGAWKRYQLLSPLRAVKYTVRNQTGDTDSMIAGLPWIKTAKMAKDLVSKHQKEVAGYFKPILTGKIHEVTLSPELERFANFGAFEGLLAVQEIGDAIVPDVLQEFSRWEKQEPEPSLMQRRGPAALYKGWMRKAEVINNWREAANRYAVYRVFLEDIRKNGGKPSSYSASLKEEVDALETNEEKAYRMSNDLMGAYDEVSRAGQWIRKNLIPFWSYQELNFKRYARLIRNGVREGMTKEMVGKVAIGTAARAPYLASRVAATGVKMYALWALVTALNGLFAGDDDDKLRKDVRLRPHLTFGSTPDGKEVIYFPRIGNINDILEWLDLDEMQDSVKAAWEGRKPWGKAAKDVLRGGPLEKLFNSAGPQIKYPIEAWMDKTTYPNIDRPREIESWPEKIAQDLGLGDYFRGVTGRPNRKRNLMQQAADLVIYRSDPKESGYYDTLDLKRSWMREQGLPENGGTSNKATTEALRNVKTALRKDDQQAFNTYLRKYVELGGTEKGFDESVRRMAPLHGLNKEQQARFIESLSAEDKRRLDLALDYYNETFLGDTAEKYFREFVPEK